VHADNKLFLKGVLSHHGTHFKYLVPLKISLEQLKLETSDFVHWLALSLKWVWSCHMTSLNFGTHTHNRFTAGLEYVRVHPGQQVPER